MYTDVLPRSSYTIHRNSSHVGDDRQSDVLERKMKLFYARDRALSLASGGENTAAQSPLFSATWSAASAPPSRGGGAPQPPTTTSLLPMAVNRKSLRAQTRVSSLAFETAFRPSKSPQKPPEIARFDRFQEVKRLLKTGLALEGPLRHLHDARAVPPSPRQWPPQ